MQATRSPASGWLAEPVDIGRPEPLGGFWALAGGPRTSVVAPRTVFYSGAGLTPDATEGAPQLYVRDNDDLSMTLLTPNPGPPAPEYPFDTIVLGLTTNVVATTPGLDRVYYESPFAQTDDAVAPFVYNPYLWIEGAGVRLIGVLPDGECGSPPCFPANGARMATGDVSGGSRFSASGLSDDGARAYFYVPPQFMSNGLVAGQLYVREGLHTPSEGDDRTLHVNASRRTDCAGDPTCGGDGVPDPAPDPAGPLPGVFWGASRADGARALFTSCEQLTDDSTADSSDLSAACDDPATGVATSESAMLPGRDLYLYDATDDTLVDLTTTDGSGADVFGVVGASDDLSRIYFVAGGVLAPGGEPGQSNLYLWDHGQTTHVATLTTDRQPPASQGGAVSDEYNRGLRYRAGLMATRVTADAKRLIFTSRAPLTGYDNVNPQACPPGPADGWNLEGRCAEVFLYDADADELRCISCGALGTRSGGDAYLHDLGDEGLSSEPLPRNLGADGTRAYFQTTSALVPQDSNGRQDVYQWHAGEVGLISSGSGGSDSFFTDASPDGESVFFHTVDRLVASDVDEQRDLYVARVDGGFPEPPAVEPPCRADACQGPQSARPPLPEPSSESVTGMNVDPGPRTRLALRRLTRIQRARLAQGRRVTVKARVTRAARVRLVGRARVRRRAVVVLSASRRARRAGVVSIRVRLNKRGRTLVTSRGRLAMTLTARVRGSMEPQSVNVNLQRGQA